MELKAARIRLSVQEGVLEIEGSEEFVAKHIEALKGLVLKVIPPGENPPGKPNPKPASSIPPVASAPVDLAKYENIYSIDDGVVKILKDIPGADNSKKMVNATLLYLFGKTLNGDLEVPFQLIRDVCKDHGCLDGPNFSKRLRTEKENILVIGGGKSQKAKLTVPGKRQAQALVDQLNAA